MNLTEAVVEGTIQPDGKLVLDEKLNLPAGRVTVHLRQAFESVSPPEQGWFEFMQNARKKMEEAGCQFMDENEVQAHIEWLREGDWVDDLLREAERQNKKPQRH